MGRATSGLEAIVACRAAALTARAAVGELVTTERRVSCGGLSSPAELFLSVSMCGAIGCSTATLRSTATSTTVSIAASAAAFDAVTTAATVAAFIAASIAASSSAVAVGTVDNASSVLAIAGAMARSGGTACVGARATLAAVFTAGLATIGLASAMPLVKSQPTLRLLELLPRRQRTSKEGELTVGAAIADAGAAATAGTAATAGAAATADAITGAATNGCVCCTFALAAARRHLRVALSSISWRQRNCKRHEQSSVEGV